ncbi:MAG: OmpA family protein [Pseudomonadota bacterium]
MTIKTPFVVAVVSVLTLAACTDPGQLGTTNGSNAGSATRANSGGLNNTQQGALIGAGAGAIAGQLIGGNTGATLVGAALGTAVGAGIGYNLDQQEAELRRDLGNEDVIITNTGDRLIVTMPQDLLFETDSFAVESGLRTDLYTVATSLQQYPASTVQVIGHTDSDGAADYNQGLSEERARAVSGILMDGGVPFERVQSIGRGETEPVASNLSEDGKAQNRRVDIIIVPTA